VLFRTYSKLARCGVAVGLMGATILLRLALGPVLHDRFPFLLQFLAMLVCARYLGLIPGIAALVTALAVVIGRVMVFADQVAVSERFWLRTGISTVFCLLVVWLLSRHGRLREELASSTQLAANQSQQLSAEVAQREKQHVLGAQLQAIVESSDDAIISKDLSGIIQSWNRGAEQIFGYTAEEAIGRPISLAVPSDRLSEEAEILERIRQGGRVKHFETIRLHRSGREIPVSLTISPIRDAAGNVSGASHIARDVTDRKLLEDQIRQTQKIESLGVLAGGLAHDFNNLLTGIMGNASLAVEELGAQSPALPCLMEVLASGERAARLVRQMLAYAGKGLFVPQLLDLSKQIAKMEPQIRALVLPPMVLRLQLDSNLPVVEADASQIQQLVMNLAINAAEAIGEGTGSVTISTSERRSDGPCQVVLRVEDTGCGMDEETRQRIFDPFFSTKFTGRGLGLPAVLGIIRGHAGSISVTSVAGRGSCFTVVLPAAGVARSDSPAAPVSALRGTGRVLVVDDEEMLRNMARLALERSGYTVETAEDGESAVDRFAASPNRFDAVLMDLTMPVMSGHEALERILSIRADVPVILSSGFSEDEALHGFSGCGPADFLQKPYTPAMLTRKIGQVLSGRQIMP
jgi:PAS domain S-box-containing protein